MPAPWKNVVERDHPFGDRGVNQSLDEVAKRVAKGALSPRVRTWAIEQLDEARRSGLSSVKNANERAKVLLRAVQKKLWVPDPVGAEYMPAAELLACDPEKDKDQICVRGDDCDGLATLLGAAWMSVGIHTLVVGHSYDEDEKAIEHVLCAAHLEGVWRYGDPSTDLPLGQCVPPTRERVLSVPSVRVVCDADTCIGSSGARHIKPDDYIDKGVFVGVDGIPGSLRGLSARVVWLPVTSPALALAIGRAICPR